MFLISDQCRDPRTRTLTLLHQKKDLHFLFLRQVPDHPFTVITKRIMHSTMTFRMLQEFLLLSFPSLSLKDISVINLHKRFSHQVQRFVLSETPPLERS